LSALRRDALLTLAACYELPAGTARRPGKAALVAGLLAHDAVALDGALLAALGLLDLAELRRVARRLGVALGPDDDARLVVRRVLGRLRGTRPFAAARRVARALRLSSPEAWRRLAGGRLGAAGPIPLDVPLEPDVIYAAAGWRGWDDWLGTDDPARRRRWGFLEARAFARSLCLLNSGEWRAYYRGDLDDLAPPRPEGVPKTPGLVAWSGQDADYRRRWKGYVDWLGTDRLMTRDPGYLPFKRARRYVWELRLRSPADWAAWCRGQRPDLPARPPEVPAHPASAYGGWWRGWDDWIGVHRRGASSLGYAPFAEARRFAQGLGLASIAEWTAWCRGERPELPERPPDVPSNPDTVYMGQGWKGYGDFLGTERVAWQERRWRPFPEARAVARRLGLNTHTEWEAWCRGELRGLPVRAADLPVDAATVYADAGWAGWLDFLGVDHPGRVRRHAASFAEARRWARSLGLAGADEWRRLCRGTHPRGLVRPPWIPEHPDGIYAGEGWRGWLDFLGTSRRRPAPRRWRPFAEARRFARSLGLRGLAEWRAWYRGELPEKEPRPDDVPTNPNRTYEGEWRSWADWLGNDRRRPARGFRSFEEARTFVRSLGLRNEAEWRAYCRGELADEKGERPRDVPAGPAQLYADAGWRGMGDWLGTGNRSPRQVAAGFRSFAAARRFARGLGLRGKKEWAAFCRGDLPAKGGRPEDVPSNPGKVYRDRGWRGWRDFLGSDRHPRRHGRTRLPFAEARRLARGLDLRSVQEWQAYCRGERPELGARPAGLPASADRAYRDEGWRGWTDFLGTDRHPHWRKQRTAPFEEARAYARALGLRSAREWRAFCRGELPGRERPEWLPFNPDRVYRDGGWRGWPDFLGAPRHAGQAAPARQR